MRRVKPAERRALLYVAVGLIWIYASDALVGGEWPQTLKGWMFVVATGCLLYGLLRRYAREIEASQAALRSTQFAMDHAADAVYWVDESGRFRYVNRAACRMLGYDEQQLLSMSVPDINPDFPPERWPERWKAVMDAGVIRLQSTHRRGDGSLLPMELVANAVQFDGNLMICAFGRDISDRLRAEQALRESEERFRRAILDAPIPVVLHAGDEEILVCSNTWTEQVGDLQAASIRDFREWRRRAAPATDDSVWTEGVHEVVVNTRAGAPRQWEVHSAQLGRLADGRQLTVTMALDLTERRRMERQLLQSQKMEVVGRLAAGIAHDFNNFLTLISGYADLIRQHSSASGKIRDYTDEIARAAERATGLTAQLLAFTRQQIVKPVLLGVDAEVQNLESMLRRIIGENIKLLTDLAPDAGYVRLDRSQFGQVLLNLVVNARDAMPSGGAIRLATRPVRLPDPREPAELSSLPAGDYCVLYVTDSGTGISREVRPRLFEPFFTTKELGQGTGLGLPTVRDVVEGAGGRVTVESEVGEGSTFAVWLPRAEAPADAAPQPAEEEPPVKKGAGTVLVVEDDTAVRQLVAEILRTRGYSVIEAAGAEEVIGVHDVAGTQPDLLVTDVVMRGMSGVALARALRDRRPGLKVLFISGYADVAQRPDLAASEAPLLQKPFLPRDLVDAVRRELNS